MGKGIFTKFFGILVIFALFANSNVWAGGGMFGRGPDGNSGGSSSGGNSSGCQENQYKDYLNSNGSCHNCPTPYPKSASGTTDITGCYNDDSGQKVYWSSSGITLSCTIGWYVPANSHTCAPCQSGHLCPGGNFYGDVTYNQRSRLCMFTGNIPNVDHTECLSEAELFCDLNKYRDASGNCQECPSDFPKADGHAIAKTHCYKDLSDRRVYYSESNRLCEDGYYKDSAAGCIKCQGGFSHSDSDATTKFKCWDYDTKNKKMYYGYIDGTGTEAYPKTCDSTANCTKCPDNTYVKAKTNWCSACPSGKICMGGWYFPNMNANVGVNTVDSHGCRSGSVQGNTIINEQYYDGTFCQDCPISTGFIQSDLNATSRDQCYKQIGNKKVYYKQVSCGAGKYLPKASSECKACLDGHYCTADKYYPSLKDDQGLKTCESGKVPNSNKTACVNDNGNGSGGGTLKCGAGQYVPAGLGRCQSCTGTKKYCPGGNYQYPKSVDQGILDCPENAIANTKHDGCYFNLSSTYLKNGPSGAKTKFGNQCWTKTNTVAYAKCLFPNGIDSIANPGLVIDDKVEDTAPATEPVAMD